MRASLVVFAAVLTFQLTYAKEPPEDTLHFLSREEVVVTAERYSSMLREATAPVSVLTFTHTNRLPAINLADVLKYVPGLTFVSLDGSGNVPIPIVRGFYGGGETEYIRLLIDGLPVNDLRTGLIDWGAIDLSDVERIEVLRGGGSSSYGDGAIGAVISVFTSPIQDTCKLAINAAVGSYSTQSLSAAFRTESGGNVLLLKSVAKQANGFRNHSRWEQMSLGTDFRRNVRDDISLLIAADIGRMLENDPGPLTTDELEQDRSQSHRLFDGDHRRKDHVGLNVALYHESDGGTELNLNLGLRLTEQGERRTILLAPSFGNTQFHDESSTGLFLASKLTSSFPILDFVIGIDAGLGWFDSRYYAFKGESEELSGGDGSRVETGMYLEGIRRLGARVRLSAGLRYDIIGNSFDDVEGHSLSARMESLTSRFGLNYCYLDSWSHSGNVYANVSGLFKTPSLDQLFDQRKIPVDQSGLQIGFSNDRLRPQRGTNYEIGAYHRMSLWGEEARMRLAMTVYRMDLRDEIDFDLRTYQYGNIGRSRHDGIESTLSLQLSRNLGLDNTISLTDIRVRAGDDVNNELKGIPCSAYSNRMHLQVSRYFGLHLVHSFVGEAYLDDKNTQILDRYRTFDAALNATVGGITASVTIRNLLGHEHSTGGYTLHDPVDGSDVSLLYPAAGRSIFASVRTSF